MPKPTSDMSTSPALTLFQQHFAAPPVHFVRAPGRLEMLGNHTDYNDGIVLSVAIDRYLEIAAAPRADGLIELVSTAFPAPVIFPASELLANPAAPWANYVKGVLDQLRQEGVRFSGFNAAFHGGIPMGAGMSSSAALEVSTALMLRQLYPYRLTEGGPLSPPVRDAQGRLPELSRDETLAIAKLCRAAENEFVGVQSGLLDQLSSLCGQAGHVMEIDFRFLTVKLAPLPGAEIIVCNSGVNHALVGGEYNELRENCVGAARALGVTALRSVNLKNLLSHRDQLSPRQFECAHHIVTEIERVVLAEQALRAGETRRFGQYMFQSHESSRDWLKNSAPELDVLVELARAHPGCLGARLTGGGFGGATVNLVLPDQVSNFIGHMTRQYQERTGHILEPVVCRIVAGAAARE